MAYPTVLFSADGEQFSRYREDATGITYPLGTQLVMQDGRKFRFTRNGGTLLAVANVMQAGINTADHVNTTAVATAIAARAGVTTLGSTLATINDYREGYMVVSVTPDGGSLYVIGSHAAVASGGEFTGNFAPGFSIQAAWTTTSRIDLIRNPYRAVIEAVATTVTGPLVGVTVSALAANSSAPALSRGWLATHGPCAVETVSTLVIGQRAVAGTDAGEVMPAEVTTLSTYVVQQEVGIVMRVAAATAFSTIYLTIDK